MYGITMTVRFEDGVEVVLWGQAMIDFIAMLQREGYEIVPRPEPSGVSQGDDPT